MGRRRAIASALIVNTILSVVLARQKKLREKSRSYWLEFFALNYLPPDPAPALGVVPGVGVVLGVAFGGRVPPGKLMSGVPGVLGAPGVEGFPNPVPVPVPVPVPLLLPGAPVLVLGLTPKCEYTLCIQVEFMVGQELLLKVGALCSVVLSTLAVNWPCPLEATSRHGSATSCPPAVVPIGVEMPGVVLVPMPLVVGVPVEGLFTEMTAN
jgi:hypothetical protein